MWTLVVALLLAFVMPAMAYIPLVQGARGAPLQKNGKPPSPKPRSARSSRQAVMSVDDEFGCVKCTKAPQRDALVRTAFTLMPSTADAATASSRQSGKKSGGGCPCCPADGTCCVGCDAGCKCHA